MESEFVMESHAPADPSHIMSFTNHKFGVNGQPQNGITMDDADAGPNGPHVGTHVQGLSANSLSTQSAPIMTNCHTTVTRTILQPYMANINSTGTSGFRSPSLSLYTVPELNYLQPMRRPIFPSSRASNGYQFPAPIRSPAAASWASLPSTSQAVWSQMTTGAGPLGSVPSPEVRTSGSARSNCKRKVATREEESRPSKVFIDEERMSSHLQGLNLDNNNLTWHPDLEEDPWYSQSNNNNAPHINNDSSDEDELMDKEGSHPSLPKIELSEDLKLSFKTKQILPKVILDEIAKPSMQLVLWKPPEQLIPCMLPIRTDFSNVETNSKEDEPLFVFGKSAIGDLPSIPLASRESDMIHSTQLFDSIDDDMDL